MNNHRHVPIVVRIGIDKGLLLESCFKQGVYPVATLLIHRGLYPVACPVYTGGYPVAFPNKILSILPASFCYHYDFIGIFGVNTRVKAKYDPSISHRLLLCKRFRIY
jgi:hypothetical protein